MATLTPKDVAKYVPEGFDMDPMIPKIIRTSERHCELMLRFVSPYLQLQRRPLVGNRNMTTFSALGLFAVGDTDFEHRGAGHVNYLGPPGSGKSLLAKVHGSATSGVSKRFQGTADALPADITGHYMFDIDPESGRRIKRFIEGPVFSNVFLLDEASRLSPRTQSGVLEVMGEGQVTTSGDTRPATPFFILTGNPIESEGVYQLGDALKDRIMFTLLSEPFTAKDFAEIMKRTDRMYHMKIPPVGTPEDFEAVRLFFYEHVRISDEMFEFIGELCARANDPMTYGLYPELRDALKREGGDGIILHSDMSISGRTAVHLKGAARALAAFHYRDYVTKDDVLKVLLPVMRHRAKFAPGVLNFFRMTQKSERGMPISYAFQAGDEILRRIIRDAWRSIP